MGQGSGSSDQRVAGPSEDWVCFRAVTPNGGEVAVNALLVAVLVFCALLSGLTLLLQRVRADQDAKIAAHWRRNGRERNSRGW